MALPRVTHGTGSLTIRAHPGGDQLSIFPFDVHGEAARLIIEYGKVTTYNANRPHGFGVLDPETFAPYPKNPVIGAFFREIDRADELGFGMRNMMQYGNKYGGADPQLIEADVFRMVISVPEFCKERGAQSRAQSGGQSGAQSHAVLTALTEGPRSAAELVEALQLRTKTGAFKRSMQGICTSPPIGSQVMPRYGHIRRRVRRRSTHSRATRPGSRRPTRSSVP